MMSEGSFEIRTGQAVHSMGIILNEFDEALTEAEVVIFQTYSQEGSNGLSPISTSIINDNGTFKTALKYLYDQSQNAIPLSGEVTGSTSLSAIDKTAITNKTTVTIDTADYVLISDSSDSGNLKKGLVSDLGGFDDGDFTLVASFKSLYNY